MSVESFDQISTYLRLIKAVTALYERRITAAAAEQGLTKPEAAVLLFLANNPQYRTARDVVSRRGLSKAYVSKAVEQLAGRGLLTVQVSAADRRVQHLGLTALAMGPVQARRRAQGECFRQMSEGVTPEETTALGRLCQRVFENISHMD